MTRLFVKKNPVTSAHGNLDLLSPAGHSLLPGDLPINIAISAENKLAEKDDDHDQRSIARCRLINITGIVS